MFLFDGESILDIFRNQHSGPELEIFGGGSVRLSKNNIVYFEQVDGWVKKSMPYFRFRENAYFYSEYMTTPCADLLIDMEVSACINAKKNRLAKHNLIA